MLSLRAGCDHAAQDTAPCARELLLPAAGDGRGGRMGPAACDRRFVSVDRVWDVEMKAL